MKTGKWIKSSLSGGDGGNCVEVRAGDDVVEVRDTKNREGGTLAFEGQAWRQFVEDVRNGSFDL